MTNQILVMGHIDYDIMMTFLGNFTLIESTLHMITY
jgi:hypothetical protein